jgi:hypothetical protein
MAVQMRPGDWRSFTSATDSTFTSGTSSSLLFYGSDQAAAQNARQQAQQGLGGLGGQQAVTPEEARYSRFWTREYNPMHDRYDKRLNKKHVHDYLTHMGLHGDPEYAAVRKHPHVFESIFGKGSYMEYMQKPTTKKAKTGKPTPVLKKKSETKFVPMRARPPGHERIRVPEGGRLIDALQSSFDNWVGKNQLTFDNNSKFVIHNTGLSITNCTGF